MFKAKKQEGHNVCWEKKNEIKLEQGVEDARRDYEGTFKPYYKVWLLS